MIVRKDDALFYPILFSEKRKVDIRDMPGATWKDVVASVLESAAGPVTLSWLYEQIEPHKKHRTISGGKKKSGRPCKSIRLIL